MSGLDNVDSLITSSGATTGKASISQSSATKLEQASVAFQQVTGAPPSAGDISSIHTDAQDNSGDKNATPTLYAKLKDLARECD
jgi:hypothetical protein